MHGHEVQYKKCQYNVHRQWKVTSYLSVYNLCGHVLSSVQIAKYLGITLTDELSWSCHVHLIHSHANSTLGFLRRNLWCCPAKLKETAYNYYVSSFYTGVCSVHLGSSFGLRTVICWRSCSGDLRDLLKGITEQHPVCPRCCMIFAGVTLKTAGGTLDWLCSTRLSLGM